MENNKPPGCAPQPLLIFVLGGPCSGKSTLCRRLTSEYHLEHFSLSDELRDLVSPHPVSRAALIKPTLSTEEIHTFTYCLSENILGPRELTSKYIKERLFGVAAREGQVRMLVDGFPRDLERWEYFKEIAKDCFNPKENTFLFVLNISTEMAWERYQSRGRPGDDFDKRFAQHNKHVWDVSNDMLKDGVQVLDLLVGEPWHPDPVEPAAEFLLHRMDEWASSY